MAVFRPNIGNSDTISSLIGENNRLEFGTKEAHADFTMPVAAFTFYNAFGEESSGSKVYIRMTSSFETSARNQYAEADGIFGQPSSSGTSTITDALGVLAGSGLEALQRQVIGALAGGAGFFASGGLSGKSQIEFLTREAINNFTQLVYRGPQFRPHQLSFLMRPTSKDEAEQMIKIIGTFKAASGVRKGQQNDYADILSSALSGRDEIDASEKDKEGNFLVSSSENIDRVNLSGALPGETNFTFGYPNLCSFTLIMYKKELIATLFESKKCVIESVNVTYGSQNKLTFFENSNGKYFPSEVNLQLSLKEIVYHTHSDSVEEFSSKTIL